MHPKQKQETCCFSGHFMYSRYASQAKTRDQLVQPRGDDRAASSRQQAENQQGTRRARTHEQNETAIHNKVKDTAYALLCPSPGTAVVVAPP